MLIAALCCTVLGLLAPVGARAASGRALGGSAALDQASISLTPASTTYSYAFDNSNYYIDESAGSYALNVTRSGSTWGSSNVCYSVTGTSTTATGELSSSSTTTHSVTGTLSFAARQQSATITLPIADQDLDGAPLTATALLFNCSTTSTIYATQTLTLLQNSPPQSSVQTVSESAGASDYFWFSTASADGTPNTETSYDVNENAGDYPLQINRSHAAKAGSVCWGDTILLAQAGNNFRITPGTQINFAAGQSTATVEVPIIDQGINGPTRYAQAFLYNCGGGTVGPRAYLSLLQNDPLATRNAADPLGYGTPTDGDPLQFVNWYVFGSSTAPGKAAIQYRSSHPSWAAASQLIADTPGSQTYRFWMWNQPTSQVAKTVQKYLADAELAQPNTTVALSSYDLLHGPCQSPAAIRARYESWIDQVAYGIGNFRVVMYLEEDALMERGCLSHGALKVREQEIAYAVNALERDPHVVVYIDAGASDALTTPAQMARLLEGSGLSQAQGFAVNATHFQWTTTEVHWGQQISALTGGKHFVVQTDDNGRGPLLSKHPATQGVENLCAPPGRGLGVLSWMTGYEYVDGFLWFNNPGMVASDCRNTTLSHYSAAYVAGLVARRVYRVTGPHFNLLRSQTNM